MFDELNSILEKFRKVIKVVKDYKQLEEVRVRFLGEKGVITLETKKILLVPFQLRKTFGLKVNKLKNVVLEEIRNTRIDLEKKNIDRNIKKEHIDITSPGRKFKRGKIHPISHTINLVQCIFNTMGFEYVDGPEIETEWNNFTALNIDKNHSARQMHDTFYIKNSSNKKEINSQLLRTHTSTVQIHHMLKNKPPLKVFSVGKVYRSDYDATHTPMFYQLECFVVDKKSNVSDLQTCLQTFLKLFFDTSNLPIRYRTSYFPFTEPSFEVDIQCDRSDKNEIKIGMGHDWLEILGCGIINKKVLKNVNVNSKKYQGFAIGVGIERLAMLKYNIADLRSFFTGDLRWLKHYGF